MDTVTIRQTIAVAIRHEEQTGLLASYFKARARHLHSAIRLNTRDSASALLLFTRRYIEHVPEFIDALRVLSEQNGNDLSMEEAFKAIQLLFISPPGLLKGYRGLALLLCQAYLSHRLVEEINEQLLPEYDRLLIPMDMTRSNLVAHHIIGEPFANQLDKLAEARGEVAANNILACSDSLSSNLTVVDLSSWPCLADILAVSFSFGKAIKHDIH